MGRWLGLLVLAVCAACYFNLQDVVWETVAPCSYWSKEIDKIEDKIEAERMMLSLFDTDEEFSFLKETKVNITPAEMRKRGFSEKEITEFVRLERQEAQEMKSLEQEIKAENKKNERESLENIKILLGKLLKANNKLAKCD